MTERGDRIRAVTTLRGIEDDARREGWAQALVQAERAVYEGDFYGWLRAALDQLDEQGAE